MAVSAGGSGKGVEAVPAGWDGDELRHRHMLPILDGRKPPAHYEPDPEPKFAFPDRRRVEPPDGHWSCRLRAVPDPRLAVRAARGFFSAMLCGHDGARRAGCLDAPRGESTGGEERRDEESLAARLSGGWQRFML